MMLFAADVPWWTKLWWHGVDIAVAVIANLISATILAGVGLLLWNWRTRRELAADRKEWRLREGEKEQESVKRLEAQREACASRAERSREAIELNAAAAAWLQWLDVSGLSVFGSNSEAKIRWVTGRFLGVNAQVNFDSLRRELASEIRSSEIRAIDPSAPQ